MNNNIYDILDTGKNTDNDTYNNNYCGNTDINNIHANINNYAPRVVQV